MFKNLLSLASCLNFLRASPPPTPPVNHRAAMAAFQAMVQPGEYKIDGRTFYILYSQRANVDFIVLEFDEPVSRPRYVIYAAHPHAPGDQFDFYIKGSEIVLRSRFVDVTHLLHLAVDANRRPTFIHLEMRRVLPSRRGGGDSGITFAGEMGAVD